MQVARKNLQLVVSGGSMRLVDRDLAETMMKSRGTAIRLNGSGKVMERTLLCLTGPLEHGLESSAVAGGAG